MTPAQTFMARQKLPWQLRLMPERTRLEIAASFTKHRGRFHGDKLARVIRSDLEECKALPPWVWLMFLNAAIRAAMVLLEIWWTHKPRWGEKWSDR